MVSMKNLVGLQILSYGSALSTYVLIVIGGYVVFNPGSGLACGSSGADSWPLCNGQVVPTLSGPVLVEWTHRLFAVVVSLFVLGTAVVAWTRFREESSIVRFSTAAFLVLIVQVLLGMVTVRTELNPLVSTAHLAVASALFATVILNAMAVRRLAGLSRKIIS